MSITEWVREDPLGEPFVLMVRSASKGGRWHRVKWYKFGPNFTAECDSGLCEADFYKPSRQCRHERIALAYLQGENLEELLADSIKRVRKTG